MNRRLLLLLEVVRSSGRSEPFPVVLAVDGRETRTDRLGRTVGERRQARSVLDRNRVELVAFVIGVGVGRTRRALSRVNAGGKGDKGGFRQRVAVASRVPVRGKVRVVARLSRSRVRSVRSTSSGGRLSSRPRARVEG